MPDCGQIYSALFLNLKYIFNDSLKLIKLLKSNETEIELRHKNSLITDLEL